MSVTNDQMKIVEDLKIWMNRNFEWRSDDRVYRVPEFWNEPKLVGGKLIGDCEDYAIHAFRTLVERGFPKEALRLAICRVEDGSGHCVLMITEGDREWIFDNRQQKLARRYTLAYTDWMAQQVGKPISEKWVTL